jgi:hypothetical protein
MVAGLRDEKVMLTIFWGMPLLLLAGAVFSITSQARKERKEASEEARRKYDLWSAKEQTFSFDQAKWILETDAGRREIPWSSLLKAVEWPHVFYLVGENGSVIVPSRVFDAGTLMAMRKLLFPVLEERWPCRMSCWDYQATETARLWRKHWFQMGSLNLVCLYVLSWILENRFGAADKAIEAWGWVIGLFVVVLLLTGQLWYFPLKYFTSPKAWRLPQSLNFSDRGLYSADSHNQQFTSWRSFREFLELRRAFLIYGDRSNFIMLSKRYFPTVQQNEIRRLLEKHVAGK